MLRVEIKLQTDSDGQPKVSWFIDTNWLEPSGRVASGQAASFEEAAEDVQVVLQEFDSHIDADWREVFRDA